ncbi:glycosyltransferase family 39 protein [Simiduia curdlanivorans]|uniref:Glycosyltransferase family 39 protein n=1 Tax=Simiduia curdlanivorans TaxID=1492769 RepID=A0ABV8V588_9GAMM|nr:glycosyltransferase family 39 protein [Simiduia curdlanivorans]
MKTNWLALPLVGLGLIVFFLCAHLMLAPFIGLGVDEAHYALYGQRPDWSYFDHPPMVGWLHWLGLQFGQSEFFVRLPAMLLWPLILLQVWLLSRAWYGDTRVANIAVALLVFSPLVVVLGFGLVPDTPLILVSLLLAQLVARIERADGKELGHWLGLGVLLGLAGLSKYTAVFLALALLVVLIWHQRLYWLARPGPWLAVVLAAAVVFPVFYWNWSNDWLSFTYQFNHGAKGDWSALDSLRYAFILLLSFGPLLVLAATLSTWRAKAVGVFTVAQKVVLLTAALLLVIALWSAGNGEDLPHWTVMSWVLLSPFAASWLLTRWAVSRWPMKCLLGVSGLISALTTFLLWLLLIAPPLSSAPQLAQAVRDLHGWPEVSARALALKGAMPEGAQLWVTNWTIASRIAWYTQEPVQVLSSKPSQFLLWWGEPKAPALLVRVEKRAPSSALVNAPAGVSCSLLDTLDFTMDGVTVNYFMFYQCQ